MNYSELVTKIQEYTENDETTFVSAIPTFVKNAEKRIFHIAELPAQRLNKTSTTTNGDKYLTVPDGFLYAFSLAVATSASAVHTFLLNKDVNFIREAYPTPTTTGTPKYYALFDDDTFILGPTPNAAYFVELHYAAYPTSIVNASTTFIGDNFESALLYGSLVEAYIFMKGEKELIEQYDKQFKEDLTLLKNFSVSRAAIDAYRK